MTGVVVEVVGRAAAVQGQEMAQGEGAASKKTSALEISGKAAVERNATEGTSLKLIGKTAVESRDGTSLEIIGRASVENNKATGVLQIVEKSSAATAPPPLTTTTTGGGRTAEEQEGQQAVVQKRTFSWSSTSAWVAGTGIGCWCVLLLVRFLYLWEECLVKSGATGWAVMRASAVLGMEVGLVFMAILLVLMIPRMIVTWTTAVVVEYMFGVMISGKTRREQVVRDGTRRAKEISWLTLTSVVGEGNAVAAASLLVCFTTTAALRHMLKVG